MMARCITSAYGDAPATDGGEAAAQRLCHDEKHAAYLLERLQPQLGLLEKEACRVGQKPRCAKCPVRHFCDSYRARRKAPEGPGIVEIFAGAGGMGLGFEQAGFRPLQAIDMDLDALHSYIANRPGLPKDTILHADAAKLVEEGHFQRFRGKVDGIIGGPPCQTFSLVGMRTKNWTDRDERMETDTRTWLPVAFARAVDQAKPRFVVMENVAAFQSALKGRIHGEVIRVLEESGYVVGEKKVWAHRHGVAQKRWRYILIAFHARKSGGARKARERLNRALEVLESGTRWGKSLGKALEAGIGESWRIGAGEGSEYWLNGVETWNHITRSHNARDLAIYKALKPGETAAELEARRPATIPYSLDSFRDKYRKLHLDAHAPTIPAHLKKDANSFVLPEVDRGLTPREAATIQGFPRDYIFIGEITNHFQQIGNAVPPPVARVVANLVR